MRLPSDELAELREQDLYRELRRVEETDGCRIRLGNRWLTGFASNDYLGLAASPDLRAMFAENAGRFGAGAGASRLITGSQAPHRNLEEALADFKQTERALAFSSGYAAAIGTLTAVLGKGDVVILDKLCHASLIDGARLSGATIRVYPHNDLDKLTRHLEWAARQVDSAGRVMVVTESVFSMDGDRADLRTIVEIKERFGALLLVDEAHAAGVFGRQGRGLADEEGVAGRIDLQMGTLSKAIGLSGGYIAASADWVELLINRSRSLIYSTAPSPALAATAVGAIELVRGPAGEQRRQKLRENMEELAAILGRKAGSPIFPFHVGESADALALSRSLERDGFLVPAIRFPTVPRGTARLRISLSAGHQRSDLENLGAALKIGGNKGI